MLDSVAMLDSGTMLGRAVILGGTAYRGIAGIDLSIPGSSRGGCGYEKTAGGVVELYGIGCGIGASRR